MEEVELVIKLPKELYETYKGRPPMLGDAGMDMIAQSIANGTPLPKGHGDLIDKSKIKAVELEDSLHSMHWEQGNEIDLKIEADAIIEADKEKRNDP